MNLLQILLWKRMIRLIGNYHHRNLDFHGLVDQLEVVLETAEVKDRDLVRQWYVHWNPLEEFDQASVHDPGFDHEKAHPLVERMRTFLAEKLQQWEKTPNERARRPLRHHLTR